MGKIADSSSIDVTAHTRRNVNERCDVSTHGEQGMHLHRTVGQARVVLMTAPLAVVIRNNMNAELIEKSRTVIDDKTVFEVVPWHLPTPVPGCEHPFKCRPALVVNGD